MDSIIKSNIIKAYNQKTQNIENFYKCKKYMVLIDEFMTKDINNQNHSEPDSWTDEVDLMFAFLFNNAAELIEFKDKITIEYKDKYIELFEMQGQGFFRSIRPTSVKPDEFVSFKDIVKYEEFNKKPLRTEVLKLVNLALNSMEVVSDGLEMDIEFEVVRDYLKRNLK